MTQPATDPFPGLPRHLLRRRDVQHGQQRHALPHRSAEQPVDRQSMLLAQKVPERRFDCRLGELMPIEHREMLGDGPDDRADRDRSARRPSRRAPSTGHPARSPAHRRERAPPRPSRSARRRCVIRTSTCCLEGIDPRQTTNGSRNGMSTRKASTVVMFMCPILRCQQSAVGNDVSLGLYCILPLRATGPHHASRVALRQATRTCTALRLLPDCRLPDCSLPHPLHRLLVVPRHHAHVAGKLGDRARRRRYRPARARRPDRSASPMSPPRRYSPCRPAGSPPG